MIRSALVIMLAMLGSFIPAKGYADYLFLPTPREISYSGGTFSPGTGTYIRVDSKLHPELLDTAEIVVGALQSADCSAEITETNGPSMAGAITINPDRVKKLDGYELTITPKNLRIVANSPAGAFYAAQTLRQICQQTAPGKLMCLTITDWPDFPNRGIMLDISRNKVPTMETLYKLVDMFAGMKLNQLQLYTEHTFAYEGHEVFWEGHSPMTPRQIRELDAYCRQRFVQLVPNQNSFGHLAKVLRYKEYEHLRENPKGGGNLDPTNPESLKFIAGLYDQLLPNFSSKYINVGCDEVGLGDYRSKAACEEKGKGRVYLDHLLGIYELCKERGRTMMFWADIIHHYPELIAELPKDVVAMEWGYNANHPFDRRCAEFKNAGVPFYICPGSSSWNAVLGRTDKAMANLLNAAENGLKHGAIGYLNTDWGDWAHVQYLPVSYLPFAYGAALSWCTEKNKNVDVVIDGLDMFIFQDTAGIMGRLMFELGNADLKIGPSIGNYSTFPTFFMMGLKRMETNRNFQKLTADPVEAVKKWQAVIDEIDRVMKRLPQARMQCDDADLIKAQVEHGALTAKGMCRYGILCLQAEDLDVTRGDYKQSKRLLDEFQQTIIPEHRRLWLLRNRPGGLEQSVQSFKHSIKFLKKVHLDHRLWEWDPSLVSEEWQEIEFELPKELWDAPVNVQFLFTGGRSRLDLRWVALVVNGKEVTRDEHNGTTGAAHRGNVYNLPAVPVGAQSVIVRASVRTDGDNDSYGVASAENATTKELDFHL